jgi:quinoprotein glucose dehydrogenase
VATEGGTKFRAHDKRTGDIVWETDLGARQTGLPMTYVVDGKQIILVPAGAPGVAGEFIALRLEESVSGTAAAPATRR